nr:hypothetical protein [Staphylococcus epidermidis]
SISQYHRMHGGDLIWEVASGCFGCRADGGTFSEEKFIVNATDPQVKMIELKAQPGGPSLAMAAAPAPRSRLKLRQHAASLGVDCISPSSHSAFSTPVELMHFIAKLRRLSGGKPTGFKFCVGHLGVVCHGQGHAGDQYHARLHRRRWCRRRHRRSPWSLSIVGVPPAGRPAAGAQQLARREPAPPHQDRCSGKVITAFDIARMMALGADWCNSGRGFMMALGCIQAQSCHTGTCPTGVTTQDPVRQKALVVPDKATRAWPTTYNTMHALQELVQAAGLKHPKNHRPPHCSAPERYAGQPAVQPDHARGARQPAQGPGAPAQGVSNLLATGAPRASSFMSPCSSLLLRAVPSTRHNRKLCLCATASGPEKPEPRARPTISRAISGKNSQSRYAACA